MATEITAARVFVSMDGFSTALHADANTKSAANAIAYRQQIFMRALYLVVSDGSTAQLMYDFCRNGGLDMSSRFPNAGYQIIALFSVILVIAEVMGMLKGDGVKIAILLGVAIVALLAPKLDSLTIGKDGIVAGLSAQLERAAGKIDESKSATVESDQQMQQQFVQLFNELKDLKLLVAVTGGSVSPSAAAPAAEIELPPVTDEDDPQKGRFGGREKRDGYQISALVEQSSLKSEWCKVTLCVAAMPGRAALSGRVVFYVHNSFDPDRFVISAVGGEAKLVLQAWGAFTVGVVLEGNIMLELDLATSPNINAPSDWRSR